MRDDAPTWSDEDHVGYLRIDLASTDRANHAQFMILLAGVLFGIGGGVIATWVTQFGYLLTGGTTAPGQAWSR
jgi:hypothetical protein